MQARNPEVNLSDTINLFMDNFNCLDRKMEDCKNKSDWQAFLKFRRTLFNNELIKKALFGSYYDFNWDKKHSPGLARECAELLLQCNAFPAQLIRVHGYLLTLANLKYHGTYQEYVHEFERKPNSSVVIMQKINAQELEEKQFNPPTPKADFPIEAPKKVAKHVFDEREQNIKLNPQISEERINALQTEVYNLQMKLNDAHLEIQRLRALVHEAPPPYEGEIDGIDMADESPKKNNNVF